MNIEPGLRDISSSQTIPARRKFLVIANALLGSLGLAAASIPFVRSMLPSERARAAGSPVEVDIGRIEPGALLTVEWRGKPVWVVFRTPEMLDQLGKHDEELLDALSKQPQQPEYARNVSRSIKPQYFIATGICTHLGCVPTYRKEAAADMEADWPGGFFCPCHGSKFDLAGRVFKGVPAPRNLEIPPHTYLSETRLLIGEDKVRG